MIGFLKRLFAKPKAAGKLYPECAFAVLVNDRQVVCRPPKEADQLVRWHDLREVVIVTNDQGPWLADVWWHLKGSESECFIPQGATGEDHLIQKLQTLPGFDSKEMAAAMCCAESNRFVCWQRNDGEPAAGADPAGRGAAQP
jgi:hypothetical protein